MTAQQKNRQVDSVVERLRRYQISRGLPWRRVAERLGISLSMVMMVLRGERNLSSKAMFRLAEAEREAASLKSKAEEIVDHLIGDRDAVSQVVGKDRKGTVDIVVDYQAAKPSRKLPDKLSLVVPAEEHCRKLRSLFAETLDTRVIALACLPRELRTEGFINQLTAESRTRLISAALGLVIPDWRTLVTVGM